MKEIYDVVVIGSGFGGAITACRLAQAGRSVCVLERGKRWQKSDFPRTLGQMAHAFWNDADCGLIDYRVFRNIDVLQASGVGGGSLVYFNVHKRAKKEIFEQPRWPRGIKREILDPYYNRAREMLEARPLTPPSGLNLPPRTKTFLSATHGLGKAGELLDICVYTGPDRLNPHSGIPQQACVYCGNCMLGCHVHAKNTLDLNYLPVAEHNGAEIYPLHEAHKIEPLARSEDGYRVTFRRFDAAKAQSEFDAVAGRRVIVSAGTLGSTELLLRCRDVHRTLPKINTGLGAGFSGNGDYLVPATIDLLDEVDAPCGPSITAGMDVSTDDHLMYIQDLGLPDPFFWYLQGALPSAGRLRSLWLVLKEYLLRVSGMSSAGALSVGFDRLFEGGLIRCLPYLGMGNDDADGRMRLVSGELDLVWKKRSSRRMFSAMEDALGGMSRALGGKYSASPLWRWPLRKLLTAHPLGGCVMSDSGEAGVVDEFGQVWNYPNLFVVDGSIIPTALAINPSATISALAERAAEHMISG